MRRPPANMAYNLGRGSSGPLAPNPACSPLRVVLRHALALAVHQADDGLRVGVPLLGGLAVPDEGLRVVLRHALAHRVHQAEAELREGVPLLGQWTQNLQFRRVVAFLIGFL
jgi:hypothetical protein